jgi:hypothetical protein
VQRSNADAGDLGDPIGIETSGGLALENVSRRSEDRLDGDLRARL